MSTPPPSSPPVDGLVTVVMPAYQRADSVAPALRSVLGQSYRELEVLVVDDGSTDDTAAVAEAVGAGDARLRVIRLADNQGRSAARNRGIDEARGEFVTFIDSDDLYAPARIERLVAAAARFPADDVFIDDVLQWARRDGRVVLRNRTVYPTGVLRPRPPHHVRLESYIRWSGASKLFLRRSLLDAIGARFPTDMAQAEDRMFMLEVLFAGRTRPPVRVAEPLYWYQRPFEYRADATWLADAAITATRRAVERTRSADLAEMAPRLIRKIERNPDDGDPERRSAPWRIPPEKWVFAACYVGARLVDAPARGRLREAVAAALGEP